MTPPAPPRREPCATYRRLLRRRRVSTPYFVLAGLGWAVVGLLRVLGAL